MIFLNLGIRETQRYAYALSICLILCLALMVLLTHKYEFINSFMLSVSIAIWFVKGNIFPELVFITWRLSLQSSNSCQRLCALSASQVLMRSIWARDQSSLRGRVILWWMTSLDLQHKQAVDCPWMRQWMFAFSKLQSALPTCGPVDEQMFRDIFFFGKNGSRLAWSIKIILKPAWSHFDA